MYRRRAYRARSYRRSSYYYQAKELPIDGSAKPYFVAVDLPYYTKHAYISEENPCPIFRLLNDAIEYSQEHLGKDNIKANVFIVSVINLPPQAFSKIYNYYVNFYTAGIIAVGELEKVGFYAPFRKIKSNNKLMTCAVNSKLTKKSTIERKRKLPDEKSNDVIRRQA